MYFWLESSNLAIERVKSRVKEGGHNIPKEVIIRRYNSGIKNLFNLYIPICDYWMIFNNSGYNTDFIAEGYTDRILDIKNNSNFVSIKKMAEE